MKRQFFILASIALLLSCFNGFAEDAPPMKCIQDATSGFFVNVPMSWSDLPKDFVTCKTDNSSGHQYCTLPQTISANVAGGQFMFQSVSPDVCSYGPFTFKTEASSRTIFGVSSLTGKVVFSVNGQALELVVTPDGMADIHYTLDTLDFSRELPQIGYCNPTSTSDHRILCCKDKMTHNCGVV